MLAHRLGRMDCAKSSGKPCLCGWPMRCAAADTRGIWQSHPRTGCAETGLRKSGAFDTLEVDTVRVSTTESIGSGSA